MNLFLTGLRGIGKTTALNRAMRDFHGNAAGFVTYSGFVKPNGPPDVYIKPYGALDVYDEAHRIIERVRSSEARSCKAAFETTGVSILRDALESGPDLIVIDEIGIHESDCEQFKDAITACLDSEAPVLGVLRKAETAFLDSIRNRPDVELIEVTEENRDGVALSACRHFLYIIMDHIRDR